MAQFRVRATRVLRVTERAIVLVEADNAERAMGIVDEMEDGGGLNWYLGDKETVDVSMVVE